MLIRKGLLRAMVPLLLGTLVGMPAIAAVDPVFDLASKFREPYRLTVWGKRFEAGVGVDQDLNKAVALYCKSARRSASSQPGSMESA